MLLGRSPGVLRDVLCSLLGVGERVELVYVVGTMDSLFDEAERVLFECPCRGLVGVCLGWLLFVFWGVFVLW